MKWFTAMRTGKVEWGGKGESKNREEFEKCLLGLSIREEGRYDKERDRIFGIELIEIM